MLKGDLAGPYGRIVFDLGLRHRRDALGPLSIVLATAAGCATTMLVVHPVARAGRPARGIAGFEGSEPSTGSDRSAFEPDATDRRVVVPI